MAGSEMKTHKSAVVIIPPEEIWEPIQKIRRLYDRQCHRWMPHITLIYPFRPRSELERAVAVLSSGITALRAFALRLHRLQYFTHDRDRFTMWLDPGPREPIAALQARSRRRCPTADDVSKFPRGFTPHPQCRPGQGMSRARGANLRYSGPMGAPRVHRCGRGHHLPRRRRAVPR